MSSKNDYPKPKNYSPAKIMNGVLRKDREDWVKSQREQGLPTTPPPDPKNYSPAEHANGLFRKDKERITKRPGERSPNGFLVHKSVALLGKAKK